MKIDAPQFVLAIDCETSGLVSGKKSDNPAFDIETGEEYQAIEWGICVVDLATFDVVEHYHNKIKFNRKMKWNARAEAVHKNSIEQLDLMGIEEEDFVCDFAELVSKYWGTTTPVILLGHNVQFDLAFIRRALKRHGVAIHFSNRMIDTNSIGMGLARLASSDQMFEYFGMPPRGAHSALEDILMTILAAKNFRMIYENGHLC